MIEPCTIRRAFLILGWTLGLSLIGCARTTELAHDEEKDAAGDASPDASLEEAGESDALVSLCSGKMCKCANTLDDDMDGLKDDLDPECLYSLDDDEGTFATGLHDQVPFQKGCQDCFFDNDSDFSEGCKRSTGCLSDDTRSGVMSCSGGPNKCQPDQTCINNCVPKTPNGCDCFGCCEVHGLGLPAGFAVRMVSTCSYSLDKLMNEGLCPRCELSKSCKNDCEECEKCLGKKELPANCGGVSVCSGNRPVCGPQLPCAELEYCYLGCCLAPVVN